MPSLLLLFLCLSNKVETKAVWLKKNKTSNPKSSMDRMERSEAERRLLAEQQARAAARALAALLAQQQAARMVKWICLQNAGVMVCLMFDTPLAIG